MKGKWRAGARWENAGNDKSAKRMFAVYSFGQRYSDKWYVWQFYGEVGEDVLREKWYSSCWNC